ncbi:MAG: S8 family serine peptidase [Steroidobacteraceae bacterium]|nr:S8 family serine peptidase [Steroidobacteraceae bacterium]
MTRGLLAPLLACLVGCTTIDAGLPEFARLPADAQANPDRYVIVTVPNRGVVTPMRAGSTPRGYDEAPTYTVSREAESAVRAIAREFGLTQVAAWPIEALRVHCVMYAISDGVPRDELVTRLAADPRVAHAQPLQTFGTSAAEYDDQYFGLQSAFDAMSVTAAHRWSQGSGVVVAVIDTGVDLHHPDLAGRIRANRNFVDRDAERFTRDRHGTEIAGVIAAVGNNGRGIVGVAPRVELVVLKACWQAPSEPGAALCNSFTLAQALSSAIAAGADVINLSLTGPSDTLLASLVVRATAQGAIVVGAVPRSGRMDGFPAAVPGVLAVAMAEDAQAPSAALTAPGVGVLTLVPNGGYDFATGSSLATANVSGIAALLRASRPGVNARTVNALLVSTTHDRVQHDRRLRTVDACSALASLLEESDCPVISALEAAPPSRAAFATGQ